MNSMACLELEDTTYRNNLVYASVENVRILRLSVIVLRKLRSTERYNK